MTLSWKETAKNQMGDDKKNEITFNYAHDNITFFLDSIFVDVYWNGNNFSSYQIALKNFAGVCTRTDDTLVYHLIIIFSS